MASVRAVATPLAAPRVAGVSVARTSVVVCAKYKLKTKKAAAKRFKITATGKVLRRKPGKQHINEKCSRNRLRRLSKEDAVAHGDYENVIRAPPYAGVKRAAFHAKKPLN